MTVGFLTSKLVKDTVVTIVDRKTGRVLFEGQASKADFNDRVKDWNFSHKHIIYI